VPALGFGKGVSEAIALKHTIEPEALLPLVGGHSDRVQRRQMILRELTQVRVGGGDDGDNLAERGDRDPCPAIGLGHGYRPEARTGESIELLRRQPTLTVPLRRFFREFESELACNGERFLVRADAVGVRREIEARRLL
jgi:hypothetical protein